jgi:mRNA interferase YafQ
MMYKVETSSRFRRELKVAQKRGLDIGKLEAVVDLLSKGVTLPLKNKDHALTGDYTGYRECHIAADWLLVYRVEEDVLVLYLFSTGTH